jgi:hypothetical protein
MQIINIFIALIVALGFWKRASKERDLKTAKASFTKTFILVLLTIAFTVFYYKTYQVATFKNFIEIFPYKGSFGSIKKPICYEGNTDTISYRIPYDKVSSLVIFNSLSKNEFNFFDPKRDLYHGRNISGIEVKLSLDYNHNSVEHPVDIIYGSPSNLKEMEFCYDVNLLSNTIPSLFPLSVYEENDNREVYNYEDKTIEFESYARRIEKSNDDIVWGDYDKLFCTRLMSTEKEKVCTRHTTSETLNTLNFFSAADLSQCNYQFIIRSSVPIDIFSVCFDLPVEVTPADINQVRQDSRDFSINIEENEEGKVNTFKLYHIKFPSLSNMQLIRSLILTTILTALYSLTLVCIYYYCRRLYKKYLYKHSLSYKKRKKMVLLWLPAGKIIVWSFLIMFSYALILTIFNSPFSINNSYIIPVKIIFFFVIILYCILVVLILYVLHRKNIYLRDIRQRIKLFLKQINDKIREIIYKTQKNQKRNEGEDNNPQE